MLVHIYDVWVSDGIKCLNLSIDESLELSVPVEDLDCVVIAFAILRLLDFAACTDAKSPSEAQGLEDSGWLGFFDNFLE